MDEEGGRAREGGRGGGGGGRGGGGEDAGGEPLAPYCGNEERVCGSNDVGPNGEKEEVTLSPFVIRSLAMLVVVLVLAVVRACLDSVPPPAAAPPPPAAAPPAPPAAVVVVVGVKKDAADARRSLENIRVERCGRPTESRNGEAVAEEEEDDDDDASVGKPEVYTPPNPSRGDAEDSGIEKHDPSADPNGLKAGVLRGVLGVVGRRKPERGADGEPV